MINDTSRRTEAINRRTTRFFADFRFTDSENRYSFTAKNLGPLSFPIYPQTISNFFCPQVHVCSQTQTRRHIEPYACLGCPGLPRLLISNLSNLDT